MHWDPVTSVATCECPSLVYSIRERTPTQTVKCQQKKPSQAQISKDQGSYFNLPMEKNM